MPFPEVTGVASWGELSRLVCCLVPFSSAHLQFLFGWKIDGVWFYPASFFPNINEKHFLTLLSALNSILAVSVHKTKWFALKYFCSFFFSVRVVKAARANRVHSITLKFVDSFLLFPTVLRYFFYRIVAFGSFRILSEIFHFVFLCLFFPGEKSSRWWILYLFICTSWWNVVFFHPCWRAYNLIIVIGL